MLIASFPWLAVLTLYPILSSITFIIFLLVSLLSQTSTWNATSLHPSTPVIRTLSSCIASISLVLVVTALPFLSSTVGGRQPGESSVTDMRTAGPLPAMRDAAHWTSTDEPSFDTSTASCASAAPRFKATRNSSCTDAPEEQRSAEDGSFPITSSAKYPLSSSILSFQATVLRFSSTAKRGTGTSSTFTFMPMSLAGRAKRSLPPPFSLHPFISRP
mmetsp:Transcript_2827/g.17597  ORF Transcript_2827/g.17597 Transcript_2827/m.17597 type:complete len:216 (-) Transcript_2827:123-770(-)